MTEKQVWFGPTERPLFGLLNVPPGNAVRAGVVLCPPLGREDLLFHGAYRTLATRLEQTGMAVLRFDYDGTGDSAGFQQDPSRVAAWSKSTQTAIDLMRTAAPPAVAAVGIRMGALFAALDAVRAPLDSLVLWDPCRSGRAILREQHALHRLSVGRDDTGDGSVEASGFRFNAETAADLSMLDITGTVGPMAADIYLLSRADRSSDSKLVARLKDAGHLELGDALGQRDLLTVNGRVSAEIEDTIDRIVTWLWATAALDPVPFDSSPFDSPASAVVALDDRGRPIVESAVRFGAADLFGVITEVADQSSETTVVCFNTARSRHIGPSRLWVELSRTWAREGIRTIRLDVSGVGDSGTHPGQERDVYYPPEASKDIEDLTRFVSFGGPSRVVLVGLCSGAYHAILGGLALHAWGVCAINPGFPDRQWEEEAAPPVAAEAPRPLSPGRRWSTAFAYGRMFERLIGALPESVWWLINRLGLRSSPTDYIKTLVRNGAHVVVVLGSEEAAPFLRGDAGRLRRLARSGRLRFDIMEDLHHAMLGAEDSRRISEIVNEQVVNEQVTEQKTAKRSG